MVSNEDDKKNVLVKGFLFWVQTNVKNTQNDGKSLRALISGLLNTGLNICKWRDDRIRSLLTFDLLISVFYYLEVPLEVKPEYFLKMWNLGKDKIINEPHHKTHKIKNKIKQFKHFIFLFLWILVPRTSRVHFIKFSLEKLHLKINYIGLIN